MTPVETTLVIVILFAVIVVAIYYYLEKTKEKRLKKIKKEKEAANKSDIVITENKQGGYRLFYNKKEKLLISFKFDYIFDFIEGPYYFKYLENYTIKKPFLTNKNKQIIIVPSVNMLVNNVYKKIEIKENNKVLIKE